MEASPADDLPVKSCIRCGHELPLDAFGKNKRENDGLNRYCKPCTRELLNESRERNREAYREQQRRQRTRRYWEMKVALLEKRLGGVEAEQADALRGQLKQALIRLADIEDEIERHRKRPRRAETDTR